MFTGIILATGRVTSLAEEGGDLELGIDAARARSWCGLRSATASACRESA